MRCATLLKLAYFSSCVCQQMPVDKDVNFEQIARGTPVRLLSYYCISF